MQETEQDVRLRSILEQCFHHLPLCLHNAAASMVANDVLRAFKRNGVICEFGAVPKCPERRHSDKPEGFHHD